MLQKDILICRSVVDRFAVFLKSQKMAHAYLFIGTPFIGKSETAFAIAKLVNCLSFNEDAPKEFCDVCESCRKINIRQHPDVHFIDVLENKTTISMEQIQGILEQMRLKPFEARKKVFIIKNIENIQHEAAHTLLKTLEEPTKNSLFLLTTSSLEKNLDTIISRCHAIYFPLMSRAVLKQRLMVEEKQEEQKAHFLAYYTQGCQGRVRVLEEQNIFERKDALLDQFISFEKFVGTSEKITEEKDEIKEILEVLLSWIRDAVLLKLHAPVDDLVHIDRLSDLEKFTNERTFQELEEIYQHIKTTMKLLGENLNVKIPLLVLKERLWEKSYKSN
ncbi:MAG TPA: DNA polymerase III subunit [Candidatus Omnitrophota bacterium]|nr:DNA polymerase III subunit [Candidatus Omnitrophota bacterium]